MAAPDRKEYLNRLIPGIEQAIENTKFEIPYYKPDDLQLKYAKKFLAAMEESLVQAKAELAELEKGAPEKKDYLPFIGVWPSAFRPGRAVRAGVVRRAGRGACWGRASRRGTVPEAVLPCRRPRRPPCRG